MAYLYSCYSAPSLSSLFRQYHHLRTKCPNDGNLSCTCLDVSLTRPSKHSHLGYIKPLFMRCCPDFRSVGLHHFQFYYSCINLPLISSADLPFINHFPVTPSRLYSEWVDPRYLNFFFTIFSLSHLSIFFLMDLQVLKYIPTDFQSTTSKAFFRSFDLLYWRCMGGYRQQRACIKGARSFIHWDMTSMRSQRKKKIIKVEPCIA